MFQRLCAYIERCNNGLSSFNKCGKVVSWASIGSMAHAWCIHGPGLGTFQIPIPICISFLL